MADDKDDWTRRSIREEFNDAAKPGPSGGGPGGTGAPPATGTTDAKATNIPPADSRAAFERKLRDEKQETFAADVQNEAERLARNQGPRPTNQMEGPKEGRSAASFTGEATQNVTARNEKDIQQKLADFDARQADFAAEPMPQKPQQDTSGVSKSKFHDPNAPRM